MKIQINLTDDEFKKLFEVIDSNKKLKIIGDKIKNSIKKESKNLKKDTIKGIVNSPIISEKSIQGNARYRKIAEEYRDKKVKEQTKSEIITKASLKSLKISYDFQKIFYNEETFYIVDFYLPEYNVVLEIDGGYHNDPEQRLKDSRREKFLKRFNRIKYIGRIKNEETLNTIELRKKIMAIVNHSKTLN